jgi:hypothetical protein
MRLLIAIGMFMLSLVLMLTGLAERTIWAPPVANELTLKFDAGNAYVHIPNSVLTTYPGKASIRVSGSNDAFVATGRDSDIAAWIGDSAHTSFSLNAKHTKLIAKSEFGQGANFSPVHSDLWRSESFAPKRTSLVVNPADSAGAIVASDGFLAAPNRVTIYWPTYHDLTPSNVLLISGFVILLASLIINGLAYRDIRNRRGPRRKVPKAPQGPRSRIRTPKIAPARGRRAARKVAVAIPASILSLALLTGCSTGAANVEPTPTATAAIADPPVLTEAQLERILGDVASVAGEADTSLSAAELAVRFMGPAYDQRSAHYILKKRNKKAPALPKIVATPVTFNLPAASTLWPRSVMVVTDEAGEDKLPQMIVLQQATPRAKYLVWYTIGLLPGASIPPVVSPEIGAIPVAPDAPYLSVAPNTIPKAYGDVIDNGAGSTFAKFFDFNDDEFYKQVSSSQEKQQTTLKNGKITFAHLLGSPNVISLATNDGGALVAVSMIDAYRIRPTKAGSAVQVAGDEAFMLGANGSVKGVLSKYGDMLLMYVPPTGSSELARIIGVTQGLLSVVTL